MKKQVLMLAGLIGLGVSAKANESHIVVVDKATLQKIALEQKFPDLENKLLESGIMVVLGTDLYALDMDKLELQKKLAVEANDQDALIVLAELSKQGTQIQFKKSDEMQVASQDADKST